MNENLFQTQYDVTKKTRLVNAEILKFNDLDSTCDNKSRINLSLKGLLYVFSMCCLP